MANKAKGKKMQSVKKRKPATGKKKAGGVFYYKLKFVLQRFLETTL